MLLEILLFKKNETITFIISMHLRIEVQVMMVWVKIYFCPVCPKIKAH